MQLLFIRSEHAVELATSKFLGLEVSDHPLEITARFLADAVDVGHRMTVVPLNPHVYCTALSNPEMAAILGDSLVTLDGFGILMASRFLGHRLRHRFTGTDLMEGLLALFARNGKSIFLLGGTNGVTDECARRLNLKFPGIRIAGTYEPPMVDSADSLPDDDIVMRINRSGADVLFVAFGAPKQEVFLQRNRGRLTVSLAMSVGASFDFLSKRKLRAPLWMRRRGLEWVFRILQEPVRLGPRYLVGIPRFLWCTVIRHRSIL
jgi:N-acetylglucosaminyldiphosphoundecaprenol N-acetyl-beta-D-mannosaminyltransferase